MKKIALITGILGQDGPYLAKLLLEKDYKVYGLIRRYTNPNFSNLDYLGITDKLEYLTGDMTDEASIMQIIKTINPDEVYNLAAQSFVGSSWDLAKQTTEVNALGVLYILNAIKFFSPSTKFYQASTSEMFGNQITSKDDIINEETPFHPTSPYAIAKLYAHWLTINYRDSYGIFTCNGILFNHESPIRGIEFVTRKISDGVARIKLGLANNIKLGNTDSQRDWGFAGDFVEAMYLMLQKDKPGDYLLSTGETHSIKDFLAVAFKHVGIEDWEKYIKIDPKYKRPSDLRVLKSDSSKSQKKLGWQPKVAFNELVTMMVDEDMKRLSNINK
ncbi:MAG: GDP-mannose 4,6-dehydratase [bacterium]|nr:GDP-mannose 4,6-dehydratase [bacterium]